MSHDLSISNRYLTALGRRTKGGLVLAIALLMSLAFVQGANAQNLTKVRFVEVVRDIWFAPVYVGLAKGFFKEEGLDVSLSTAWGGQKSMAKLLSGSADIVLQAPESVIYVAIGEGTVKTKMFAAMDGTDAHVLMSSKKMSMDEFKWDMLKGKKVMGKRPASTPELVLEWVLKKHGIDPMKDIELVMVPSSRTRTGRWILGEDGFDFGLFDGLDVPKIMSKNRGYPMAILGHTLGEFTFTAFLTTDDYIKSNPKVVQAWANAYYRTHKYVAQADPSEIVELSKAYFPKVPESMLLDATTHYKKSGLWDIDPESSPALIDKLQDVLISGGALKPEQRVKYEAVFDPSFIRNAKATVK